MSLKATIFIPTWFGEEHLEEVLRMIFSQKVDFEYEVLIYDTSSTDKTPRIIDKYAKKHSNLRFKTIAKQDFGHGKTRDEAAHDAKGEFVVFLTQDATPAHKRWLYEMLKPFEISEDIVAVLGKQDPRPKSVPLLKNEIRAVFKNLGNDSGTTIYYLDDFAKTQAQKDLISFYSDVNSAARRDFLVNTIRYKHVPYAEAQLFGKELTGAGFKKAYAPRANVIHTNDMRLSEYSNRMFDEILGLRRTGFDIKRPGLRTTIKTIVKGVIKDSIKTVKDSDYSLKRKLYWLMVNPFYHIEKWRGVRLATTVDLNDETLNSKNSLENIRHRKKS